MSLSIFTDPIDCLSLSVFTEPIDCLWAYTGYQLSPSPSMYSAYRFSKNIFILPEPMDFHWAYRLSPSSP